MTGPSAEDLVREWTDTVTSGDTKAVADILAPEFQLVRGSGKAHDAESYIAVGLPAIAAAPDIVDVVSTAGGDIRVVRYWLIIDQTIDGKAMQRRAPRLTVFRRIGERWFVSAHANFSRPRR